jgi:hypothetical protein
MSEERCCFLCGKNGYADALDRHHIFNKHYRNKSEKYGLVVDLCHHECHIFGKNAVHNNHEVDLMVKQYGQRKAMEEQGWTIEEFRREFGKNYLDSEE